MYQVVLAKKAEKDLNRVAKKRKSQIIAILLDLQKDPYLGKTLKGDFLGYRSLRAWPYRIIYRIDKKESTVFVIRIGHRQGIYG